MEILIIYDSAYGNTGKIAQAMARAVQRPNVINLFLANRMNGADLSYVDVLVVGSPTQGGRPTKNIQNFLYSLSPAQLGGIWVAAFDTRFSIEEQAFWLRALMRTVGYAAPRIASDLKEKGGTLIKPPEGFFVNDKQGPLKDGETQRATEWMRSIVEAVNNI